jgi:hypothetical protein
MAFLEFAFLIPRVFVYGVRFFLLPFDCSLFLLMAVTSYSLPSRILPHHSLSSLTSRQQIPHFHLLSSYSLYDKQMGKEEMWHLYLILGFFEGVSSSSSLEVSLVKSTNVLLVMKLFLVVVVMKLFLVEEDGLVVEEDLVAEYGKVGGSFLQVIDSSSLRTREEVVASDLGASSSFGLGSTERMEWLTRLNGEGVSSSFLLPPWMTFETRDGSGVFSFLMGF